MNGDESRECMQLVRDMCPVILSTVYSQKGQTGAELRRLVGLLYSRVEDYLVDQDLGQQIVACLREARTSGADVYTMDRVRQAAIAQRPLFIPATAVKWAFVRICLAQQARIAVGMTFSSVDDAQQVGDWLNAAFSQAAEYAADEDEDPATYRAIVGLQAILSYHFATRARVLPRVTQYRTQYARTSLGLSQTLYAEGDRADELHAQNRAVHPAFMPREGKALTA